MSNYRRRLMMQSSKQSLDEKYLWFRPEGGTLQVSMDTEYGDPIYYMVEGSEEWIEITGYANVYTTSIPDGVKVYIKAELPASEGAGIGQFYTKGSASSCAVGGNILSLQCGDNAGSELYESINGSYTFYGLFYYGSRIQRVKISDASQLILPKNIIMGCYMNMFYGCVGLLLAPELPSLTTDVECYKQMFYGCTKLTTAPILPALSLSWQCYYQMFANCSSLNYIKALFTSTPGGANGATDAWVFNVASTGTFVKNKDATWDVTGGDGIPSGWTVITE